MSPSPDLGQLLSSDGLTKRMSVKDIAFRMLTPDEQAVVTRYLQLREDIALEVYGEPISAIRDDAVLDRLWDIAAERLLEQGVNAEAIMDKKWEIEERILGILESGQG